MATTRHFLAALVATGAVALVAPGIAGAENICVHAPAGTSCDVTQPDLQAGLSTAQSHFGADTILLGDSGSPQSGPFVYPQGVVQCCDPVTIKGVGTSRPVLSAGAGATVLDLNTATVEGVDVKLPSADAGIGITAGSSTLRDVRISGPGPKQFGAIGIKAFSGVTVGNVQTTGTGGFGLWVEPGSSRVDVTGLRTSNATEGIRVNDGASVQVTQSKIGGTLDAMRNRGTATVNSSVLETTDPNAQGVESGDGKLLFDHVSVVHRGPVDGTDAAFLLHPVDFGGQADLNSIVIAGYTRGFQRDTTENNFPFPITIRDSVWDSSHDVFVPAPNSGAVTESGDAHVDPKLVDVANGDDRLRGSSAAIDRDTRTDLRYEDVNGDGLVDGDANGTQLADAGALEYRRGGPTIDTTNVPASGTTGQALAFAATASDPDGDSVQLAWEFGDGEIGAGASASHAYMAPGIYTVTLHVTDEVGLGATRTFSVAVSGATAGATSGSSSGAGALDTIVPKLSNLRLSKKQISRSKLRAGAAKGLALRFTLSERATVRVTIGGVKVVRTLDAGARSVGLAKALRKVKHLRLGRVAIKVSAADATGNRSATQTAKLKVLA